MTKYERDCDGTAENLRALEKLEPDEQTLAFLELLVGAWSELIKSLPLTHSCLDY